MSFGDFDGGSRRGGLSSWAGSSPFSEPAAPQIASDEDFTRLARQIAGDIDQFKKLTQSLKKSAQTVGTSRDTDTVHHTIRDTLQATQALARQLNVDLVKLAKMAQQGTDSQQSKRRRMAESLKKQFEVDLKEFREVGKAAAEREKQVLSRYRGGASSQRDETTALLSSPQMSEQAMLQDITFRQLDTDISVNESLADGLESEIRELETSLLEVNEIFRDLAHMVYDQSLTIDTIENHVELAVESTDEGVLELDQAKRLQSRSRMWLCCIALLVCLLIGGIVTGLVIGLGGKKKN